MAETQPMTEQATGFAYAVDVVFCMDVTSSMSPLLEDVKSNALNFRRDLEATLVTTGRRVDQLRARVVAYRDFGYDDVALVSSAFFDLPREDDAFERFVRQLSPVGGGDIPESSLDALAVAIRSDWVRDLDRRRHVVVVFTDAPSHPLGHASGHAQYPSGLASSYGELVDQWNGGEQLGVMETSSRRLLIFAPDVSPWPEVADQFEDAIHFPSTAGEGLREQEYREILEAIAHSV